MKKLTALMSSLLIVLMLSGCATKNLTPGTENSNSNTTDGGGTQNVINNGDEGVEDSGNETETGNTEGSDTNESQNDSGDQSGNSGTGNNSSSGTDETPVDDETTQGDSDSGETDSGTTDESNDDLDADPAEPATESGGETETGGNMAGICPNPAILTTLSFNHAIAQNYSGTVMQSSATGSSTLTIGSKGISGSGKGTVSLSGSMPHCVMEGKNYVTISATGDCNNGMLTINLTESYSGGSITTTCDGHSGTSDIPATTQNHIISLPLLNGATYSAPFSGPSGSGTYNWTLNYL